MPFYSDYIDICRVWARQSIKDDFASINESDEEMWTSMERNLKNGVKFKLISMALTKKSYMKVDCA